MSQIPSINGQIVEEFKTAQAGIQSIDDRLVAALERVKELRSDRRHETRKFNKRVARYPNEAIAAEVTAYVKEPAASAETDETADGDAAAAAVAN